MAARTLRTSSGGELKIRSLLIVLHILPHCYLIISQSNANATATRITLHSMITYHVMVTFCPYNISYGFNYCICRVVGAGNGWPYIMPITAATSEIVKNRVSVGFSWCKSTKQSAHGHFLQNKGVKIILFKNKLRRRTADRPRKMSFAYLWHFTRKNAWNCDKKHSADIWKIDSLQAHIIIRPRRFSLWRKSVEIFSSISNSASFSAFSVEDMNSNKPLPPRLTQWRSIAIASTGCSTISQYSNRSRVQMIATYHVMSLCLLNHLFRQCITAYTISTKLNINNFGLNIIICLA